MAVLKRLYGYLKPYWKQQVLIFVLLLFWTALDLLPPLFQGIIVDKVIIEGDLSLLAPLIIGLVLVYAAVQLVSAVDLYLRHALGERFILDLRMQLYEYLQRLSLSYFERTSTGEIMSRITNDVNELENYMRISH